MSRSWLDAQPGRTDLVQWLAIRADTGGEFYRAMLDHLVDHGALTPAQEAAARQAWKRAERADALRDPTGGQWGPSGRRRGNAEYRAGA